MRAVCFKPNCIGGSCVIEAPLVSWDHVIKEGYWCMPCCILEKDKHSKLNTCSAMPTIEDIRDQNRRHGRCGIDFNPELNPGNCKGSHDLESRVSNPKFSPQSDNPIRTT